MKTPLLDGVGVGIATGGGVGFLPLAPGTFGALLGVLAFFPLSATGPWAFLVLTLLLGGLGVWSSDRAEAVFASKDDGRIVIDEVVGQLITLWPLVWVRNSDRFEWEVFFGLVVTGFVAFRVLDIAKPGVIRRVERNVSGGAGVMADDCVAGVFGAAILTALVFAMVSLGIFAPTQGMGSGVQP